MTDDDKPSVISLASVRDYQPRNVVEERENLCAEGKQLGLDRNVIRQMVERVLLVDWASDLAQRILTRHTEHPEVTHIVRMTEIILLAIEE